MSKHWARIRLDLHLDIDLASGRRSGLESALRAMIREGRLAKGTVLPSTRGLAQELGLSRGTVSAAYNQLVEEGFLIARPRSGTAVADVRPSTPWPESPKVSHPAPLYDLRPGLPDVSSFPTRMWLASTRRVLARARPEVYGAGDPQGRIELRTALADYLGRTRGVLATPDRIVITNGYYQAVSLLCAVLRANGASAVAAEDPGHNVYRDVLRRAGLAIHPLPVDEQGARVEMMTPHIKAAFLTPSHQYPTGVPLQPGRRQEACAWARSTGGVIVEDDYDGEFRYDRQPVGALQGVAPEHVVYCGSTSKALGPALRLAWCVLPSDLVEPMVRAKQEADLYTETLGQLVLADLIAVHAHDRHIRAARLRYRRRRALLIDRVATMPALTAHGVPAGLHALVTLPIDGPGEDGLLATCADRGLALRGLTELHHSGSEGAEGLLIGFAAPSERAYPSALNALSALLNEALA